MKHRILVIDDEIGVAGSPERTAFLRAVGYYPATGGKEPVPDYPYEFVFHSAQNEAGVNSVESVKSVVLENWPASDGSYWALVLLDVRFGEDESFGFTLLRALREDARFDSDLPIVMLTSEDDGKKATADILRANGFFPKADKEARPLWNKQGLEQRVLRFGLIPDDRDETIINRTHTTRLLGNSLSLLKVLRDARSYALNPSGSRILYGETGTGKTELAGYIHCYSDRRNAPYVHWFADPLNKEMMKSELFGWWHRSWTGSQSSQPGKIEEAHSGTFFLDEVANLSIDIQMALLQFRKQDAQGWRTLARNGKFPRRQQQEARDSVVAGARLLDDHRIQVNVLLLTGTKNDLEDENIRKELGFRDDLHNALGTPLRCPRLNDRRDDIPLLFNTFVRRILTRTGTPVRNFTIAPNVFNLLQQRDWSKRGNIRDLERIAEYAAQQLGDFDTIRIHSLPADVLSDSEGERATGFATSSSNPEAFPVPMLTENCSDDSLLETPRLHDVSKSEHGALARAELEHLRRRAELLETAAEATRKENPATGSIEKYLPTPAITRLMGNKVTSTNAIRIIMDIVGSILEPSKYLIEAYGENSMKIVQDWVSTRPVLMELFRYAKEETSKNRKQKGNKTT